MSMKYEHNEKNNPTFLGKAIYQTIKLHIKVYEQQTMLTIIACPAAAITMSASQIIFCGSAVRECTIVTVASSFSSSNETGNPTMLLLPTTTARFPFMVIPLRFRSSMHPCWNKI